MKNVRRHNSNPLIARDTLLVEAISETSSAYEFRIGKNTHLTCIFVVADTSPTDIHATFHLVGRGAKVTIVGLLHPKAGASLSMYTLQHHEAPETTSTLLVKSILERGSALLYEGSIRVEKRAQKTDAYQRNENLLLEETARAESKPALEILANDVRCTHGATVGTLDPQALWYAQTRGIDSRTSRDMIAQGFLRSGLQLISDDSQREKGEQQVLPLLFGDHYLR